jgi:hypothetical protein
MPAQFRIRRSETIPTSVSGRHSARFHGAIASRFDDTEMKQLMLDVVSRAYRFIHRLFDEDTGGELLLRLAASDLVPQWDDPTMPGGETTGNARNAP